MHWPKSIRHGNLAQLREALWAGRTNGGMFVAVDVENTGWFRGLMSPEQQSTMGGQIGISTLSKGQFKTLNFVTGSKAYREKAAKRPALGTTVPLKNPTSIATMLASLTRPDGEVFLIGHAILNDLLALRHLSAAPGKPPARIIDTQILAQDALPGIKKALSLKDLLTELGVTPGTTIFHSAGNDSRMTLHAAIVMALRSRPHDQLSDKRRREAERLLADSLPIPDGRREPTRKGRRARG